MSSLTFHLADLNTTVTPELTPSFADGSVPDAITGGTDVAFSATAALLKAIFKFSTDSTDLADAADDITGACDADEWDNLSFDLAEGSVSADDAVDGAGATNVKSDYVRHFSKQILGSSRADLFGNEEDLVATVKTALSTTLNNSIKTSITNNNTSIANDLYRTIVNHDGEGDDNQLHRITDLANDGDVTADGTTYDFPFESGDKLVFKVTVTHDDVSIANTKISEQEVDDKAYLVTITVS